MITSCPKCHHPIEQHYDEEKSPIGCINHKVVIDGDLYDTGSICDCDYSFKEEFLKGLDRMREL